MFSIGTLEALVSAAYEAGLDSRQWPDVLGQLAASLRRQASPIL
jgi:hypothetical protein